jgi:hypothetical protein
LLDPLRPRDLIESLPVQRRASGSFLHEFHPNQARYGGFDLLGRQCRAICKLIVVPFDATGDILLIPQQHRQCNQPHRRI